MGFKCRNMDNFEKPLEKGLNCDQLKLNDDWSFL